MSEGVAYCLKMASRWRDWSGLCHVDSYARDAEREIQSAEAVRFTRVEHDHSLKEFYDYYKNKSMSLSPFLELLVKQEGIIRKIT